MSFSISVLASNGLCRNRKFINSSMIRLLHTSSIRCKQPILDEKERQKKIDLIRSEMETEKLSGNIYVPNRIKDKHLGELLQLEDPVERRSFYGYLKEIELRNEENSKRRRKRTIEENLNKLAILNSSKVHVKYGLGKNSLFASLSSRALNKIYTSNLLHAVMFGQKIVIDMGYEHDISGKEQRNVIDQITKLYGVVKRDRDAFHVHFCNIPPDGRMEKQMELAIPPLEKPDPLMMVTHSSYLDHFPKERLVYLVPNCGIDLEYNCDDTYIISGIVDHRDQGPMSMAKATSEGLRVAQFPMDKFLKWKPGNKLLTLVQTMNILITMKKTNDWPEAFKHVPTRTQIKA